MKNQAVTTITSPQSELPIELLELTLVFLWHGRKGVPGDGSLKNALLVNRAWYLTSMRVMMSFVFLAKPSDLITYRRIIDSTPLTPAQLAIQGGIEDRRERWDRVVPSTDKKKNKRKRREKFSLQSILKQIGLLPWRKQQPARSTLNVVGASRTLGEHPASLCRSVECNLKSGCVTSNISWDDILTILPLLPNLLSFGLQTAVSHPCVLHIIEELSDRHPHIPHTSIPGVNDHAQSTPSRTKGRAKLERLDLAFQVTQLAHFSLRSGLAFSGLRYLSLQTTDAKLTGSLICACAPGILRTLRLTGPVDLTSPDIAAGLAKHAQAELRDLILVLSTSVVPTKPATTPAWEWDEQCRPTRTKIKRDLRKWKIVELLEGQPMVGLGKLYVDTSEAGPSEEQLEWGSALGFEEWERPLSEACKKSNIQLNKGYTRIVIFE